MLGWLIPLVPDAASNFAFEVDALYWYLVVITAFFTVGISAVIVFFAVKYRRRSEFELPHHVHGSLKLETLWSVIPFFIAMTIFVWGVVVYFNQYRPPKDVMEIYVVGKQWMWKVQHGTGQREINELHIPVGRKVKLVMTTEDVLHDFYVPAFRTKADVVPGRYTSIWFEATKPGRYDLFCAEYCGTNHSVMGGSVIVMEQPEFERWLSGNASNEPPAVAGANLFQNTLGCASCHKADGSGGRGPSLIGVFGKEVELNGGQKVVADDNYLRESILNPGAKLVAGYPQIMPTFQGQVSEDQLNQLLAYIKSLGGTGVNANAPGLANGTNANTGGNTNTAPRATPAANANTTTGGGTGTNANSR